MTVIQKLRIPLDITMTALSVILMGGTVLFPDDKVHQILGMALLALWAAHIALNRKWYGAVSKGKYNPYRIMQTVVNFGILLCAILLAVSGMMMAWFVPETVSVPLGFARTAHLVGSHWYYIFMCAHLGMHTSVIFSRIKTKRAEAAEAREGGFDRLNHRRTSVRKIIFRVFVALVCAYGVYAFIERGIAKYMFFRQPFFFLDLERGYLLFAADYISILVLVATAAHWLGKVLRALDSGRKE
ncbi:MAG: DUF4405 domain-containing protein [Treponema sp.]|nr:DUF4405 domain-containing protein [Treponema sp.]